MDREEKSKSRAEVRRESVRIGGMDCPGCASKIESIVGAMRGMESANVSFHQGRLRVSYIESAVTLSDIEAKVRAIGFDTPDSGVSRQGRFSFKSVAAVIALCGWIAGMGSAALGDKDAAKTFFILSIAVGSIFTVRNAAVSLWSRKIDINVLMMMAVSGAMYIQEWNEACAIVSLFALANALEGYSAARARREIASLLSMSPTQAAVLGADGKFTLTPVERVEIGARVLVKPGERIPLDGNVVSGETDVNEAPITGESRLIEKKAGSEVYAGSINDSGSIELETTKRSEDTQLARILKDVEDAQSRKSRSERYLDKFAAYYTPVVVAVAAVMAVVPPLVYGEPFTGESGWLYRSLVVLVAGCPCALAVAAPVATASALARASRLGVLFKGGEALEALAGIEAFAFDKTGTLTRGELRVRGIVPQPGYTEDEVLKIGASAGALSEHAVGKATLYEAEERGIEPEETGVYTSYPGKGGELVADGKRMVIGNSRMMDELGIDLSAVKEAKGAVYVALDEELVGQIMLEDEIRPETRSVVEELRGMGMKPIIMLTGDRKDTAEEIKEQAGVDEAHAELLPEDKESLTAKLRVKTAMVGDGINDAPALASSSVGIAMGGEGKDVAMDTADITLAGGNLTQLPSAIRLSKRALFIVRQNVWFAIATKAAVLLLAAFGFAKIWMAVTADVGVTLAVVFNGLRMLQKKESETEMKAENGGEAK